jgi:hypothetical protein
MQTDVLRQILATLKARKGATLAELSKAVPEEYLCTDYPLEHFVWEPILTLVHWGLVEAYDGFNLVSADTVDDLHRARNLRFYLSKHAVEIEAALGVKLDAASSDVFGKPRPRFGHWPMVFVLMPFGAELGPVYEAHIKRVAAAKLLSAGRADDFFSTGSVMADVWSAINAATVLIADCTGRNPNVFYEIGIAHAIGKPTILISQSIDDVPFDLRHLRVVVYEYTPRGMSLFEEALSKSIDSLQLESGAASGWQPTESVPANDNPPVTVTPFRPNWVQCSHCGKTFSLRNAQSWTGERHKTCGQRLIISVVGQPEGGDDNAG